jgi:hypothetical protein
VFPTTGNISSATAITPSRTAITHSRGEPVRSNDASIKIDTLGRLRASVYLNDATLRTLRALGPNIRNGIKPVLNRIVASGRSWITNLLTRIRIPRRLARALAGVLVKIAMRYLNQSISHIISKIGLLAGRRGGATISLIVKLPTNIVRTLARTRPTRLLFALRTLVRRVSFSVTVTAGYKM